MIRLSGYRGEFQTVLLLSELQTLLFAIQTVYLLRRGLRKEFSHSNPAIHVKSYWKVIDRTANCYETSTGTTKATPHLL
jgi:hypothetical protein